MICFQRNFLLTGCEKRCHTVLVDCDISQLSLIHRHIKYLIMKNTAIIIAVFVLTCNIASAQGNPPKGNPADTEVWEPVSTVVTPGINGPPPSDAIILFDG